MGYEVHITRSADWTESEGQPITREEWRALVSGDPDLGPDPENGSDDFLFLSHSVEPTPLHWWRGEVHSKDPDDEAIQKMIAIARTLACYVQGDDFTVYYDPKAADHTPKSKSLWTRLFTR